jgi:flagellin
MLGGIDFTSQRIGSFYSSNQQALSDTLMRLSSGKKFQSPADDLSSYIRVQNLQQDRTGYQRIKESLTEYRAVLDTANIAAGEVYDSLSRMEELQGLYTDASASDDEKAAYQAEYKQLISDVNTLTTATKYGTTALLNSATVATIDLDPTSESNEMKLVLPKVADISAFAVDGSGIDGTDDLATAIGESQTYMAKASGLARGVDAQLKVADSIIQTSQAAESAISDIDEAAEMAKYVDQDIRSQAALSMMSQANMSRRAVLMLYR